MKSVQCSEIACGLLESKQQEEQTQGSNQLMKLSPTSQVSDHPGPYFGYYLLTDLGIEAKCYDLIPGSGSEYIEEGVG